jgi:hypothetical protein
MANGFEACGASGRYGARILCAAGEINFALKCVARNLVEFHKFMTTHLMTAPHVRNVRTSGAIRSEKKPALSFSKSR